MADEETPETTEDKPKRPRRRRARKPAESSADAAATPVDETVAEGESARAAASSEGSADSGTDEIEPTAADEAAEDEAADVMLEAEDEVDSATEVEEQKPKRSPRRRRRGAEAAEAAESEEAPPKPAPTRRRAPRDPNLPPPVVRAQAKYVRSSARKARLVCDHLRGKSVDEARAILATAPRAVARDWSKLLESAIANAENNHELVGEDLYVKAIHADEGPTIKRFRPRAMGRATRIRKRTSHLTILLTPKE
jgi:ribosomal protein L22